jgi:hypothetical protein
VSLPEDYLKRDSIKIVYTDTLQAGDFDKLREVVKGLELKRKE